MLESLTERLGQALKRISGRGLLSRADLDDALRQVRIALLEADVHFLVVKEFTDTLRQRLTDAHVEESLTPSQSVVKAVHASLVELLTGPMVSIPGSGSAPRRILLVGLQGSGKTSLAQKLALMLKQQGLRPLLAGADLARPAAVDQLCRLGEMIGVPVVAVPGTDDPLRVASEALGRAVSGGFDPLIVDSAGRTDVDQHLLEELGRLSELVAPTLSLLVADAMTGQSAVDVAKAFSNRIRLDGVVLTKMDGDARGGAALSMRSATGLPVALLATGEGASALERFHPDRLASRILGMGDVLTLIERAERLAGEEGAQRAAESMRKGTLTFNDLLAQIRAMGKMGSMEELLAMIPGLNKLRAGAAAPDEREVRRLEAVILSMTPEERARPELLNGQRKRRIAKGAGVEVAIVNRLSRQLEDMQRLARWGKKPHMPPPLAVPRQQPAGGRPRRRG